jgi:Nuclease-related domain
MRRRSGVPLWGHHKGDATFFYGHAACDVYILMYGRRSAPVIMAQLIPNLNTCLSRMTSGEKRLARRLEALLDDDYLVWYDIPVGRRNRYPDFIILHPARGLLLLEVKDWRLENIKKISKHRVELLTDNGKVTAPNPIEQARQCAYSV